MPIGPKTAENARRPVAGPRRVNSPVLAWDGKAMERFT